MGKKMALFHSDLTYDDIIGHCGGITLPDAISGSEIKITLMITRKETRELAQRQLDIIARGSVTMRK